MNSHQPLTTRITALNQLNKQIRDRIRQMNPRFITEVAESVERDRSHVSKLFNGSALSKSALIETALLKAINELLKSDAPAPAASVKTTPSKKAKTGAK